jgi:hypothetical protein
MRAIKLVATRPGSFDVWVASIFAAAALFGLVAHATVAAVVLGLSLYWNVPYQAGFAYVALQWFAQSAIVLSYLTALAAVFHPVIAILVLLFVNDAVLRGIQTMLAAAVEAGHTSKLVHGLQSIATALYYVAPTFTPFAEETSEVNRSLHVAAIDLQYLAGTFGYAALVSVFGFLVTLVVLRRRRLT